MDILAIVILGFLALRTFVALVNLLSALHLINGQPMEFPRASILIPARNEELVIGCLLSSLQKLNYPDFEVIVCNDHSSDNTVGILEKFSNEDSRFQWFLGQELQEGWLGKNYACHQLARKAKGKYFVFLDADVELAPDALKKAIDFMIKNRLALLSVFPQQKMDTFAENITVPVMNWILLSLLPMILVQKFKFPSLAAANGQFMMFDGVNYRQNHWHSKVRNQPVEDISLARLLKSEGYRIAVLLGNRDIYCRMYRNWSGAIEGFARNIHQYFGGNRWILIGFWCVVVTGPLIIWVVWGWFYLVIFLLMVVFNRILVGLASRQSIWKSVLLHPFHIISFTVVTGLNLYRKLKKDTEWKGRNISF